MGKATKRKEPQPEWTEKFGCEGRPPVVVEGVADLKGRARVDRNTNHCTLCRLHHLGYLKGMVSDSSHEARVLSDMRHSAGEKLQDDHALSGLATIKGTLSSLEGGGSACGPAEFAQMKIDASRRLEAALKAVGTSARYLLTKMVLEDTQAVDVARILRTHKQGIVPSLRVALDALASHYGMDAKRKAEIRATHPFQEQC